MEERWGSDQTGIELIGVLAAMINAGGVAIVVLDKSNLINQVFGVFQGLVKEEPGALPLALNSVAPLAKGGLGPQAPTGPGQSPGLTSLPSPAPPDAISSARRR